jgi:hypothetical protein
MKTWKKLKNTIEKLIKKHDLKNIEIIDEDQVIIETTKFNDKDEKIVYFYYSFKDLQNPEFIINTVEKYKHINRHSILTYLGFSGNVFSTPEIDFPAEINIDNFAKISCLGSLQCKSALKLLKAVDTNTYIEILSEIVAKLIEVEKTYLVIPYGFEAEPGFNQDLREMIDKFKNVANNSDN